jgi:hypothetical protein
LSIRSHVARETVDPRVQSSEPALIETHESFHVISGGGLPAGA